MLTLGALAFANPWMLSALAGLPLLWRLLRVTPPAPRREIFPAIRLLHLLRPPEETPYKTPWWLILLRLTVVALVILALAAPLLNPADKLPGSGPLVVVVDDGWAAGRDWAARQRTLSALVDQADREGRPLLLQTTAPGADGKVPPPRLLAPNEARPIVAALMPRPWPVDRAGARAALAEARIEGPAHAAWLADGVAAGGESPADEPARQLAELLQRLGGLTVYGDGEAAPRVLLPPEPGAGDLKVPVVRLAAGGEAQATVRAEAPEGRLLATATARFAAGERRAEATIELPTELRNEVVRLAVEGETTAGAVALLDERWRRRPVGIVAETSFAGAQPLLDETYYVARALGPFSEVRRGPLAELLRRELAVLALPDSGAMAWSTRKQILDWVREGGVVVRFAGPKLAAESAEAGPEPDTESLLPVRLRRGDRALGGALSWSKPATVAPFAGDSPFAGLEVPDDVVINRQVLAEPSLDLGDRTWARLADGTPIVTGARRGDGWIVLVHTTANADWSNLALSGLFVNMMRRVIGLSQGVTGGPSDVGLPPLETLDGFGRLRQPPAEATPLAAGREASPGPATPPGYYGTEATRRALNLGPSVAGAGLLGDLPAGVARRGYAGSGEVDLRGLCFALALVLLLADLLISFVLRGLMPGVRLAGKAAAVALAVAASTALPPSPGAAQTSDRDAFFLAAAGETRLAYVITGVRAVDDVSNAGLKSLGSVLARRTAVEPGDPMGVDLEVDELAFFPLIYWPIVPEQRPLSEAGAQRVNAYLRNGGTIVFDTRDQNEAGFGIGPGLTRLRQIAEALEIPPLVQVPRDHVLTKSFYLITDFPGRWTGGAVWIETSSADSRDEVTSVVIGGHDWAAAWARDDSGLPLFPVVPGGEVQREMSTRFGINLVMYALTGNYKADQVHVPAILERLGQ